MTWLSRSPKVYRFLDKEFVDAFFSSGALRLSSFSKFAKHVDEQRLDGTEGTFTFLYEPPCDDGHTLLLEGGVGMDAYVLSASLVPSTDIMDAFGADSAIIIHDPIGFARTIAEALPGFAHGFDGPCSYQARRFIGRRYFSPEDAPIVSVASQGQIDTSKVQELVEVAAKRDAYFLKHHTYMPQNEWRFVWLTSEPRREFIDLTVPNARQYCEPWGNGANYIAFNKNGPLPPPAQ